MTTTAYFVTDRFNAPPPLPAGEHFPRHFEVLRKGLRVEFPGMLFLVGAGICGKVYCQWIKARGGIALDLGSVMDTWLGFCSRPAVLADRFADSPKRGTVPEDLLLNRGAIDRLLDRAAADWN